MALAAAIPDEITQKVIDALAKHLETMKKELDQQLHETEDKVTKTLTSIDSRRPSKLNPPPPGGSIRGSLTPAKAGSIRGSVKK